MAALCVQAEENSMNRRFLTTTLRVQVVGDYYANYKDSFRNVPVNEAVGTGAASAPSTGLPIGSVPVSLFIATVAIFFVIVVSFPFIMVRVIKGKLLSQPARVRSLQLTDDDSQGSRKESSDTTTTSILTCTSNDTCTTVYGPRGDGDSDSSSSDSSSNSSSSSSPTSSVQLDFDDAISFASPVSDPRRKVSSVSFDPEEVGARFNPPVPTKRGVSTTERFKRRLNRLFRFHTCGKEKQKTRVRFDIANLSNFS